MWRPRLGLGAKLALAMVGSLTVLLTSLGFLYIRSSRQGQEALILQSEDRLGDLIRRATYFAMLRNDRQELQEQLPEIGRMPQMLRVRIYDKTGTIRYSSDPDEVGEKVDMSADACDRCHATAEPLRRLDRPERTRIYQGEGQRIMATIHPIPNEPACANASCHVHPPDQAVLGVLDVQMSLRQVDQMVAGRIRSFLLSSILVLAVVSGLAVLWVWRSVGRPMKDLVGATRAISAGRLDQRVPERFDSELGELVASFNQMTSDLQAARKESDDWARSLEQRVAEKSRALRRAQDEMVQVEKMASLGKLAAIVAHEINNPLAGIRTYAKLLLKKIPSGPPQTVAASAESADSRAGSAPGGTAPPSARPGRATRDLAVPEEARDWIARIESEAARCGDIVRNLLSFARSSEPRIEQVRIEELIRQAVRLVQHQFDLSGVGVRLALAPALPEVECDPQQIKQALLAMLINACEAMPQGGQLTVGCAGVAESGEVGVEIRVQDTGVGMDEETRKHIFEPFFTTKDGQASGGTGLGLAVVYGIVQSHGGSIRVESAPGSGSLFVVYLPSVHRRVAARGERA